MSGGPGTFAIEVHHSGGREPRTQRFAGDMVDIGRGADSQLRLPDRMVSRRHARLIRKDGRYIVVDLKSCNGTYLNRRRVNSPRILRPAEDRLSLGPYTLIVREAPELPEVAGNVERPSILEDEQAGSELPTVIMQLPFPAIVTAPVGDEERRLLALVHEAPEQTGPRLVYADWATRRGDPRGEFIALQCMAREGRAKGVRDGQRERRLRELLDQHADAWLWPLPIDLGTGCTIEGGHAALALATEGQPSGLFWISLERGFLADPLCVTPWQLESALPAMFRLSPTIYEVGRPISKSGHSHLYQGQILGPDGRGRHVAIRCSAAVGDLEAPHRGGWHTDREQMAYALRHEFQIRYQLVHENLARVLGLARWGRGGDPCLVSEWLDGMSFEDMGRRLAQGAKPLSAAELSALACQLLAGIGYGRAVGLTGTVADDVSLARARLTLTADELLLTREGVVKIVELAWHDPVYELLAPPGVRWAPGRLSHTVHVAPEMAGREPGTPAGDVFHAASILQQLVCGRAQPYEPNLVPPAVDHIFRRALAHEPSARYSSVDEMRVALQQVQDESPDARTPKERLAALCLRLSTV